MALLSPSRTPWIFNFPIFDSFLLAPTINHHKMIDSWARTLLSNYSICIIVYSICIDSTCNRPPRLDLLLHISLLSNCSIIINSIHLRVWLSFACIIITLLTFSNRRATISIRISFGSICMTRFICYIIDVNPSESC